MEENYIVSARKYRPTTFSSVVGQKALCSTLRNAVATNRLAHAYLFCGSRGVGKTSTARIFAKSINCQHPTPEGDPCNECPSCRQFNENRSLNIIELDAASRNGVDAIRDLVEQVMTPPTEGRYRVFIIDEVHMLSSAAFNAFLKTLEEPPEYVVFILATTEKHKIIPTILSRCQIYDFHRITVGDIVDHLEYVAKQEGYTAERRALSVIAAKADGAMRDALSIFDQVAASSRGNITYRSAIENLNVLDEAYFSRLFDAFVKADIPEALMIYKEIREHGFDSHFFINGLAQYLRDLMVARDPRTLPMLDTDDDTRALMVKQGAQLSPEFFYDAMSLCNEADLNYRQASDKTFFVELLLIRLCQLNGPSPICSGNGEGRKIKKITPAATSAQLAAPAAAAAPRAAAQAAAAAPKPAPAPAAAPAAPAAAARPSVAVPPAPAGAPRRRMATVGHVRMSDALADAPQTQDDTPAAASSSPRRREPFTAEQLVAQWEAFIDAHPREHTLVTTMRAHTPAHHEGDPAELFHVTVVNAVQVDQLHQEKPRLLEHLRNALSNDYIDLAFHFDESAILPNAWSDRDVLAHLIDNNPTVSTLVSALKLTL